LISIVIGRVL
jgi:hypothetical protein